MTDADLTLRDEVERLVAQSADRAIEDGAPFEDTLADALLPLLARVREEGEGRVRERVVAALDAVDDQDGLDDVWAALAEPNEEDT